jgi:hypothetical protein
MLHQASRSQISVEQAKAVSFSGMLGKDERRVLWVVLIEGTSITEAVLQSLILTISLVALPAALIPAFMTTAGLFSTFGHSIANINAIATIVAFLYAYSTPLNIATLVAFLDAAPILPK